MNALSIEGCEKRFAGLTALNNISVEIIQGEVFGLIGPNGAGKTTLFNVISGVCRVDKGQIKFKGENITGWSPTVICRAGISRTFQIPKPFNGLTVLQNVMVGTTIKNKVREGWKKAREILGFVGLEEKMDFPAANLAVPELRRLELAKALATNPEIILLDEVLAGLRPGEIKQTLPLLKRINEQGITLIVIEHIMEVVMSICKRIAVLDYGEIIAQGPPIEIAHNPDVIAAYLGEEYAFPESK